MPTAQAKRAPGVPKVGSYVSDIDRRHLYRIEAVHRKEGVVLEDARTLAVFMLTIRQYQQQGFNVEVERD